MKRVIDLEVAIKSIGRSKRTYQLEFTGEELLTIWACGGSLEEKAMDLISDIIKESKNWAKRKEVADGRN